MEAVASHVSPQKRCVYVSTSVQGSPLVVAAVHLVSDRAANAPERRIRELQDIANALRPHQHAIVAGDFNFGDFGTPGEMEALRQLPFTDSYTAL